LAAIYLTIERAVKGYADRPSPVIARMSAKIAEQGR
jgi:hypothetical protein